MNQTVQTVKVKKSFSTVSLFFGNNGKRKGYFLLLQKSCIVYSIN